MRLTPAAPMEIQVDCYAGYRGEETPRRIRIGSRTIAVREVVDRWLAPAHRYFKVLGHDGALYLVRHDPYKGCWELVYFKEGGVGDAH